MTRGNSYVLNLRNGKQIVKEAGSLLDMYDFEYNCGGFALGLPYWYLPYDNSDYDTDESMELDDYAWAHPELFDDEERGLDYSKACQYNCFCVSQYIPRQLNGRALGC